MLICGLVGYCVLVYGFAWGFVLVLIAGCRGWLCGFLGCLVVAFGTVCWVLLLIVAVGWIDCLLDDWCC